jgi:hypothetical protein
MSVSVMACIIPCALSGVTVAIYFADPTLASVFVARWCSGSRVETAWLVFQMREDDSRR